MSSTNNEIKTVPASPSYRDGDTNMDIDTSTSSTNKMSESSVPSKNEESDSDSDSMIIRDEIMIEECIDESKSVPMNDDDTSIVNDNDITKSTKGVTSANDTNDKSDEEIDKESRSIVNVNDYKEEIKELISSIETLQIVSNQFF